MRYAAIATLLPPPAFADPMIYAAAYDDDAADFRAIYALRCAPCLIDARGCQRRALPFSP